MFSIWYIPELDLFTTRHNNKLEDFVSPVPDPLGWALGVCLSPNCANARSASRVGALEPVSNTTDRSSSALPAMASNAPQVASGLSSGGATNALRQPQSGVFHSRPNLVDLFVWSLSSVACENDSFVKQLPTVSARQLEHLPPASMTVSGEFMRVGVVQNRLVLSKPLFGN